MTTKRPCIICGRIHTFRIEEDFQAGIPPHAEKPEPVLGDPRPDPQTHPEYWTE